MNHLYFGDCLDVLKQLKDEKPQLFTEANNAGHIKLITLNSGRIEYRY